jgi:hypothetical protein
MAIFNKAEDVTFFEVLQSVAGQDFTFVVGEVLEVAGTVREVDDLETRGLVRKLPDPGALLPWLRLVATFRPVSSRTFRALPQPARETYLDRAAVLARMGWTAVDYTTAVRDLGFPPHVRQQTRYDEQQQRVVSDHHLWALSEIEQWERVQQAQQVKTLGLSARLFAGAR